MKPAGAYLDRVVSELGLSDPDSPVLAALAAQAGLDEAEPAGVEAREHTAQRPRKI